MVIAYRGDEYDVWPLRQTADLGNVNLVRFHLHRPDLIERAVESSDVVINLIAQDRPSFNFTLKYVNVDAAMAIARACRQAGKRLIHISHLAASKESKSDYLKSKYDGEVGVREAFPEAIIVRPAVVFGPEDRFVNAIELFSHLPLGIPVIDGGRACKYPVYSGDVVEGLYQLSLSREQVDGKTFDFAGYSYSIIWTALRSTLGCKSWSGFSTTR